MSNTEYIDALRQAREMLPAPIKFLDLELSPLTSTGFFLLFYSGVYNIILNDSYKDVEEFLSGKPVAIASILSLIKVILFVYLIQDTEEANKFALSGGVDVEEDSKFTYEFIVKQSDILWRKLVSNHGAGRCMDELLNKFPKLMNDLTKFANDYIGRISDKPAEKKSIQ